MTDNQTAMAGPGGKNETERNAAVGSLESGMAFVLLADSEA